MTHGSNFWVIGGEFGSMNFHKLVEGSAQVKGPFKTRAEAEGCWREVSEEQPSQGRRALFDRGRAGARGGLIDQEDVQGRPRPLHPPCRGPLLFGRRRPM